MVHLCRVNAYPLRPCRVTQIKTQRDGVESGRSGALVPGRLGLSCKANKCSKAGIGDLSVLHTHETSLCLGDAGSTHPRVLLKLPAWVGGEGLGTQGN